MADINLGVGGANSATGGYDIDNSLKFEEDNTERLEQTFSSEGDRRTFTYSFWHKRTELGRNQMIFSGGDTYCYFDSNDAIAINFRNDVAVNYFKITNAKYRDTSAWYHVVVRCDTTQGTAANRSKLWVNGEEVTSFSLNQADNMSQNHQTSINDNITHMIGAPSNNTTTYKLSGYLSEFHHVDGQALSPTDFGEYDSDSGIWKPKEYTGTYGTNGFFLEFKNAASVGADTSGNGNSFSVQNLNQNDQATDTPTNNFATMNVLAHNNSRADFTSGGTVIQNNVESWCTGVSTIAVNKGKWYAEFAPVDPHAIYHLVGVVDVSDLGSVGNNYLGVQGSIAIGIYSLNGSTYDGVNTATYTTAFGWDQNGPNSGEGDIISVALDADNGYIYFRSNGGSWANSGDPTSGSSGTGGEPVPLGGSGYYCIGQSINEGNRAEGCANYGGYTRLTVASGNSDANGYGNFEYAPPSGYYAMCSKNLAEFG